MAMLGRKRPPRRASGVSGLSRQSAETPTANDKTADDNSVLIERLAHDGRGVGHLPSGKTLFVDLALPGERVEPAIHRTRQRFDEAHVRRRLNAAPERTDPPCAYFGRCGGCDLQHMSLAAQREHKCSVVRELFARQGVELPEAMTLLYSEVSTYRRRARLSVNVDGQGRVLTGFRAAGSHRIVDIEHCEVLVPELQALLAPLRRVIQSLEAPRQVGHVELVAAPDACAITVRQLKPHAEDAQRWLAFADELADQANPVALGLLQGRHEPQRQWLTPPPDLRETLTLPGRAPLTLGFAPGDFLQAHAGVNAQMVAWVMDWLAPEPGQRLLDLFAGIGNFSLPAAAAGARVMAAEGHPAMVERLAANARRNDLDVAARQADLDAAEDVEALLADASPDVLVLDPPRAGADAVCRALAQASERPAQVAFISCDPATLARDLARLIEGGYRIRHVAVADMFMHTAHLETLIGLQDTRKTGGDC